MSVARGTRIVWIYRYAYDAENRLAGMYHFSAWVGRFSSISLFDDGPGHMRKVKQFIETAYPVFCEKKEVFELGNNLIESYLAAKAEGDLLERRGVKLAVALEILKHLFLRQAGCPVKEHIISQSKFRKIAEKSLRPSIKEMLQEKNLEAGEIEALCEKIPELNRTTFSRRAAVLFEMAGFKPRGEELELFVRQRNALVHTGKFYRYKPEFSKLIYFNYDDADNAIDDSDSAKITASYFFMLNFMDRLFLRFFAYSGAYLNQEIHSVSEWRIGNYDTIS